MLVDGGVTAKQVQRAAAASCGRVEAFTLDDVNVLVVNVGLAEAKLRALTNGDASAESWAAPRLVDVRPGLQTATSIQGEERATALREIGTAARHLLSRCEPAEATSIPPCALVGWFLDYPSVYYPGPQGNCLAHVPLRVYTVQLQRGSSTVTVCKYSTPEHVASTLADDRLASELVTAIAARLQRQGVPKEAFADPEFRREAACLSFVAL